MREHLHIDAGGIHGYEPPFAEIEQGRDHIEAQELFAIVSPLRARRKVKLFLRQNEMLLERDDSHLQTRSGVTVIPPVARCDIDVLLIVG
jgi:hypothetical protein